MGSFQGWSIGKSIAKYVGRIVSGKNSLQGLDVTVLSKATSITFTAEQVLGGLITYDPAGGSSNATMPTAALLIAALGDAALVGSCFELNIRGTGETTSEDVTLVAGTGNTLSPTTMIFAG